MKRWRGGVRRAGGNPSIMGPTLDLRISVPNNLHQVSYVYSIYWYQDFLLSNLFCNEYSKQTPTISPLSMTQKKNV